MANYKAPIRDILFVTDELLGADEHYQSFDRFSEVSSELRVAIMEEAAKFCENVVAPLNRSGDEEGCQWNDGVVTTPTGFRDAYQQFIEGGWTGLCMPEEFGGQDLPESRVLVLNEMTGQAKKSWAKYSGLSAGSRATLLAHGTEEQQKIYLTKLVSGHWTGTMCLTEPQCGSDLSFLKTKAEPNTEGGYDITGTKIFISSGEHDMAENIIHLVLAKLPDAPAGTKGLSLFIVPKFLPNAEGEVGERNAASCGSLEHKMGIHGNATCVMNFDGAKGFLIGGEHKGLRTMFTFMNAARINTAAEGVNHAEVALQGGLNYALEREAGRSVTGVKSPERNADRLIVHADVRRMLLTIRSFAEGNRAFAHFLGQQLDNIEYGTDEKKVIAGKLLALLTPVAKGFMTETGLESASLGVQIYGGHGFIREWGMEQNLRDARISTLYEGTTGIQALDLLSRKIFPDQGAQLSLFIDMIKADMAEMEPEFKDILSLKITEWQALTKHIAEVSQADLNEMGAAAVDYMMYVGYIVVAWMWGRMGSIAKSKIDDDNFYRVKYATAQFYYQRVLPRTASHRELAMSGAATIMSLADENFDELLNG
jgi:alkylation response protein AidB-like acyl-CoA dehydrogenase